MVSMFPAAPYPNINLKMLSALVPIKVRLYRARSIANSSTEDQPTKVEKWLSICEDIALCIALIELLPSKDVLSKLELLRLKG